jgi:hypothetical protein
MLPVWVSLTAPAPVPSATPLSISVFPIRVLSPFIFLFFFSPQEPCRFRKLVVLGVGHLPLRNLDGIRAGGISFLGGKSESLGNGILLSFLDSANLFTAFASLALVFGLVEIGALGVGFGVPR